MSESDETMDAVWWWFQEYKHCCWFLPFSPWF